MNFIFYLLAQTTQPAVDIVRVLEYSQKFYNDAWTNLLLVVGFLGAFVGLIVTIAGIIYPAWRSWKQEKTFEKTEKALLEKIENQQTQINGQIKRSENLQLGLIHFSSAIGLHNQANLRLRDIVKNVGTKEEIEKNIRVNIDRGKDYYNAFEEYKQANERVTDPRFSCNQKTVGEMATTCLERAKDWFGHYTAGKYENVEDFKPNEAKKREYKSGIAVLEKKIDEIKFMRMNFVGQTTGG